ncbi:DNA/RNA helicase domain-containing protein [Streptomyces dioscori]|uniref:DNA/RNA helicase domain-containing protein n=1 Tax=Streptomyces dioscori TaxID=2109333 RepID=UPI0038511577
MGDGEFKESFTYFSNFVTPPDPPLDVLICDEAHRLRDRSTNRSGSRRTGAASLRWTNSSTPRG